MNALILTIHIIVCIVLILAVLLQSGKAADLAGAFGGAGSQTAFGPRGSATLLSKVTTICAILFMLTSMGLWIMSAKGAKSVVGGEAAPAQQVPAAGQTATKPEQTPAATSQPSGQRSASEQAAQPASGSATQPETKPAAGEAEKND